jgi:DNA polymerase-4
MNTSTANKAVQWLFLHLNAFFASCEQHENPGLRGKPVIVVQTPTESAVAIAARAFGIKTGTLVREAQRLCPDVIPVQANHRLYTEYHERILKAADTCLPVEKVMSIDEMACRLMGTERQVPIARAGAQGQAGPARAGRRVPYVLDRPRAQRLSRQGRLRLAEAGRARRHHARQSAGCSGRPRTAGHLRHRKAHAGAAAPRRHRHRRRALGGVAAPAAAGVGRHQRPSVPPDAARRRHPAPSSRFAKSMGHQHVLEPELRTKAGARNFSQHLLTKAAERLRRGDYYCRRLGLHLSWVGDLGGLWDEISFNETRDTGFLLACLDRLWTGVPRYKPLSVGVVLLDLVPAASHQLDLFEHQNRQKLSPVVDRINDRYGRGAIGFGLLPADVRAFRGHAAFRRVPEAWEF